MTIEFRDDEIVTDENTGKQYVMLKGLQRVAREHGYIGSEQTHNYIAVGQFGIFQCVYTAIFCDGPDILRWSGSADVNSSNTQEEFKKFPTAVAESRAEARALRKALGVEMLAFEEMGSVASADRKTAANEKISSQVVRSLEALMESKGVATQSLLKAVLSGERFEEVDSLKQMTAKEGADAMRWLNSSSAAKAKSKSSREDKKKALQKKVEG